MSDVVLKLFITGQTPAAQRAIQTARAICERYPGAEHCLEIIDVVTQPQAAERDQILATPTLIREAPLPRRRLVGDLSDIQQVLAALGLEGEPDK